jgi:transposase
MKIRVLSQDEWAEAEGPAIRAVNEKYVVRLSEEERARLESLTRSGKGAAQTLRHAWILLKADASEAGPTWSDEQIRAAFEVGRSTIARVRRAYVEEGREAALHRRPSERVYARKVDGAVEAHLIALACSEPPTGQGRWTLRLLADKAVEMEILDTVSYETVRRVLKKRPQAVAERAVGDPARGER